MWHVAKDCAKRAAIENLAPHGLRRTGARVPAMAKENWTRSNSYRKSSQCGRRRDMSWIAEGSTAGLLVRLYADVAYLKGKS